MKLIIFSIFSIVGLCFGSVYYVDSSNGNDATSGLSTSEAWKTLSRVNDAALLPGDSVLFRREQVFRGQLIPISGSGAGDVVYGAYGTGGKPQLLGSISKSAVSDWVLESPDIWITSSGRAAAVGPELLPNPDFDSGLSNWYVWNNSASGASASLSRVTASGDYYTAPGGGSLYCRSTGKDLSDIQLWTADLSLVRGRWYTLSFKARASLAFSLPSGTIRLMRTSSPYMDYSSFFSKAVDLTTSWTDYKLIFESTATAADARIDFFLGGVIPESAVLYFDSLSFRELDGDPGVIPCDVGNVIFDEGASCGVKVMEEADLDAPGEYWYDPGKMALKLFSAVHPASGYADIECALTRHIISEGRKSYVTYEALDLRYGGAHGIGGGDTHHITVKDCDFSWIGGGILEDRVRYGNGVEFWRSSHDNTVERCTFDQVYDAACTVQGNGDPFEAYNIRFRNNIIRNSEYSFELWAEPAGTWLHDVYFENNTCLNAGSGWGHSQRPDPNGGHLMLWGNTNERMDRVCIRNNIFSESTHYGVRYTNRSAVSKFTVDYNCWWESSGPVARIENTDYDYASGWAAYRSITRHDTHSIHSDPLLNPDQSLSSASPCIDAGSSDVAVNDDFSGKLRPLAGGLDIGAHEFDGSSGVDHRTVRSASGLYRLFPNPGRASITILPAGRGRPVHVTVFDVLGRQVGQSEVPAGAGGMKTESLANGLYFLRLEDGAGIEIVKWVKY
jgi:hypothetical protein